MRIFINLVVRHLMKAKILNALNVLGLSMAMLAALLILLYADHELHYDSFHQEAETKFRLEGKTNGGLWFSNLGKEHGAEFVSGQYPEVKYSIQLNAVQSGFVQYKDKRFAENKIIQTKPGSQFFDFFSFNILHGNRKKLLEDPNSVILTRTTAEKYFGDQSAIGESLQYDTAVLKVTGVIEDLPTNSHLDFDMILTNPTLYDREHFHSQTYIALESISDPVTLTEKVKVLDIAYDEFHKLEDIKLINISDIYLESDASFGDAGKGDKLQISILLMMAGLILLIAVANYINLSLAIYLNKTREIGIRKVFGESKTQIILKSIFESFSVISFTIPCVLIGLILVLPRFSQYLEINLENKLLTTPTYWFVGIGFIFTISLLAVLYPAITLSNANPGMLMKSKSAVNTTGNTAFRSGLILIQFVLLFTLGISAWFMNRQIAYLDNKDMGFDATGVIKISNAFDIGSFADFTAFKTKLLAYPQIEGVSFGPMIGDGMTPLAYQVEEHDQTYENLLSYGVDIDYFDVLGIKITQGDFKNVLLASEAGQIVSLVNENFIHRFSWEDEPIGRKITLRPGTEDELHRKVSAVFKDFHFFSFKEKITPQIISLRIDPEFVNTNILIKTTSTDFQETIKIIEDQWYQIRPDLPMEYGLMDETIKRLYAKERQVSSISVVFSILAIALSIMGLAVFITYMIGLKSKEIAIRKVLGASLLQIIYVLNKRLVLIIFLGGIAGSALSYWMVSNWLQAYAYSIEIDPVIFGAVLALAYTLVFAITAIRSLKWIQANPVLALND